MIDTREYGRGTSVTQRYPWGTYVKARVLCSDGKVRTTTRIAQTAATFFSVPAAVKVRGKTVAGFITVETMRGMSTEADDDPAVVKFHRVDYGKNADMLPKGAYREGNDALREGNDDG